MRTKARESLLELIKRDAVLRGTFELSSGGTSDTYLDCRRVTLQPRGAVLAANLVLDWIEASGLQPDCVGGPTLGADPIVSAAVALSAERARPLPGFLVRSKAKEHGTKRAVEGCWKEGWRAVVVEDTLTTGGSAKRAIQLIEDAGMEVVAVLCLVDRERGAADVLADYRFEAFFKGSELGL